MTLPASAVDELAVLVVAGALGLAAVAVVRARPVLGLVGYLALLAFVPAWFGIQKVVFLTPASAVGLALVVAAWRRVDLRLHAFDLVMLGVVSLVVTSFLAGYVPLPSAYAVVLSWAAPYVVGRVASVQVAPRVVATCVAAVLGLVALAAVAEHLTGTNPFVGFGAGTPFVERSGYALWSAIQVRGGQARAEAAFGHSIALGATLGMAVPFVWVSALRPWVKAVALLVVPAAAVFTFSRIGMVSVGVALVLSLLFLGRHVSPRFRLGVLVLLAAGAAVVVPLALEVFSSAGEEASGSAEYRGDLLRLVPELAWVGESPAAARDAAGQRSFGGFESIDSAIVLVGLRYGLLPLLLLLAGALAGLLALLRGRREAALVAALATLPALTSVAFITQFTTFFWFVVGLAVAGPSEVPPAGAATAAGTVEGEDAHEVHPLPAAVCDVPGGSIERGTKEAG